MPRRAASARTWTLPEPAGTAGCAGAPRSRAALALAAIVGAGFALRAHDLGAPSLWLDEGFTCRLIGLPNLEIVRRTAADDHPPLYYLALKGWTGLAGGSVTAIRGFSVLLDTAALVVLFGLARELSATRAAVRAGAAPDHEPALLAAALLALCPSAIVHAREARMYPLAILLATGSAWALWRALRRSGSAAAWAAFAALAILLVYTHNYGLFVVAAEAAIAAVDLARRRTRGAVAGAQLGRAALAFAAVALAYSPWAWVLLAQVRRVGRGYWTGPISLATVGTALEQLYTGEWSAGAGDRGTVAMIVVAVVIGLSLRLGGEAGLLCALLASAPLVLGVAASLVLGQGIVASRYLSLGVPFFLIALAGLVGRVRDAPSRVLLATVLVGTLAIRDALAWPEAGASGKPGLRAAARLIGERHRAGDLVLACSPDLYLGLRHYLPAPARPYYASDDLAERSRPFAAAIDRDDVLSARQVRDSAARRAWVVLAPRGSQKRGMFRAGWSARGGWVFPDAAPFRSEVRLLLWERLPGALAWSSPAGPGRFARTWP